MKPIRHESHRTHNCSECGFPMTPIAERQHLPKHYCWKCAEWLASRQHPAMKAKRKESR